MLDHLSMTVEETLDRLSELANEFKAKAMLERYGFGIQEMLRSRLWQNSCTTLPLMVRTIPIFIHR